jgi:RHS repeat-associated protein
MGSLIEGGRDLTGQMYMRNRFYDPAMGRFTQEDPIGIAGGLNVYGYAPGDPVSDSDPYGLEADTVPKVWCAGRAVRRSRITAIRKSSWPARP